MVFTVLLHYTHNRAQEKTNKNRDKRTIITQLCKLIPGHMIRRKDSHAACRRNQKAREEAGVSSRLLLHVAYREHDLLTY